MKIKLPKSFNPVVLACCLLVIGGGFSTAHAQGTAFTYQGKLNTGGTVATGSYDFRFRLASDNQGNTYVGSPFLINGVPVTNGLFTTLVDFGTSVFTGNNYWLEVDVRTNGAGGYTALFPLQAVTPVPYAVMANSASNLLGSVPASQLSGTIAGAAMPASANFSGAVTALSLAGNGGNVTNVNARALNGLVATNFWQLGGNNVAAGQFLGSTNNQPVEVRVGGQRGVRLEFGGVSSYALKLGYGDLTGAPNLIGGSAANSVAPGVVGAVIAGGGATNYGGVSAPNTIAAQSDFSVIGGGGGNTIQTNAYGSTISGGYNNTIQTNAYSSTIGGGYYNTIQTNAFYSTISGGYNNTIEPNSISPTISGGYNNTIQTNADYSTIGGGQGNAIEPNASDSTISGGSYNVIQISASYSTIGGGHGNIIQANAYESTIGGGNNNTIQVSATDSTISGGQFNVIQANAFSSTISGGSGNTIQTNADFSTIGGGYNNIVGGNSSFAAGTYAQALNNGTFVWSDGTAVTASTTANSVTMRASGGYRFFTGSGAAGAQLAAGGTAWTTISDRHAKKNFQAVDTVAVLEKLAAIPVQQWNYQWENDNDVPNLGPMAQDFKAAFYPGRDDKGISTLEFDGVELAAIQGLDRKLNAKDAEIQALKAKTAKMDSLEKQLAELELQVKLLAEKK